MIQPIHPSRRAALRTLTWSILAGGLFGRSHAAWPVEGKPLRVLPEGELPDDARLGELRDLDAYFPFEPPKTPQEWAERAELVRRRVLVAAGLWPLPTRPELIPVVHDTVDREEYAVDRVYVESFPGLYLTGSLYRPKGFEGPRPAILSPHGHWDQGRFYSHGDSQIKRELESGAERFEIGGRYPLQARSVQLARLGCVVFHYDMLGYADSVPISYELAHRFKEQRPELSGPDRWGLFSAQAELRLINVLGLQLYNSIRALDYVLSLPEVDPDRIGITGASGGGTQTFLLAGIDDRITAAFPAVMVSTAMQGGCTCENACYLRIDTGNIELAALCAPRPLGLTGANDWTEEIESKGLPELKQLYEMLGAADRVTGKYLDFGHNFNAESRDLMSEFFNKHFELGREDAIEERDHEPLSIEELTVWGEAHPKPPIDEDAEVRLLQTLAADSDAQIRTLTPTPTHADSLDEYRRVVGGALEILIGRELPKPGEVESHKRQELDRDDYLETTSLLRFEKAGEAVPTVFLYPKEWKGRVVLWIAEEGKSALYDPEGNPKPAVRRLLDAGICVVGADLLYQGEFLENGEPLEQTRSVENTREFLGYTVGYNPPLFAQRVHDILSVLAFIRHHDFSPGRVDLVGLGGAGRWASAAGAIARNAVDALACGTAGFRFGCLTEIRDPDLLPGAVKYGDLPAMLALCAPVPLWLSGEGDQAPEVTTAAYKAAGGQITCGDDEAEQAMKWLLSL
ncbi:hypothetical protein BH23PLA1_BH23PLA1_28260 [soil metagenome]